MSHLRVVSGPEPVCPQDTARAAGLPAVAVGGSGAGHQPKEPQIDLLDRYHRYLILDGRMEGTIRNYRSKFAQWHDWALDEGHDPADVNDVVAVRAWSTTVPATESSRQMAIAAIMKAAGMLGQDPGIAGGAVERPRRAKPKNWRGLSPAREEAFTEAALASGYRGTAALIALWAAYRRSEVAGFQWQDIDLEQGIMMCYRDKIDDWHIVPIDPRLAERLEPRHAGEGWVFPSPRNHGGHIAASTVYDWVVRIAEEAGVGHITPHQLRYTCATRLYDATGSLAAAKELLGHQRLATTQTYLKLGWRTVKDAMDQMHARRRGRQQLVVDEGDDTARPMAA